MKNASVTPGLLEYSINRLIDEMPVIYPCPPNIHFSVNYIVSLTRKMPRLRQYWLSIVRNLGIKLKVYWNYSSISKPQVQYRARLSFKVILLYGQIVMAHAWPLVKLFSIFAWNAKVDPTLNFSLKHFLTRSRPG